MMTNKENTPATKPSSEAVVELDLDQVPATDIVFECPYCKKSHAINRRGAGIVISCTDCRRSITVPVVAGMKKTSAHSESSSPQTNPTRGGFTGWKAKLRGKSMAVVFASLAGLATVVAAIAFFSRDPGKRPDFNGTTISYTSAVSKRDVKKLGAYLQKSGFANGDKRVVELDKLGRTYEFRVVKERGIEQKITKIFANGMSGIFSGTRVKVHLCDDSFETISIVESSDPVVDPPPISVSTTSQSDSVARGFIALASLCLTALLIALIVWIYITPIRVAKMRGVTDPELSVISTLTWIAIFTAAVTWFIALFLALIWKRGNWVDKDNIDIRTTK